MKFAKKNIYLLLFLLLCIKINFAQNSVDFISYQKTHPKVKQAFINKLDTLIKECTNKNIKWPIQQIYIRSFKSEDLIEVWVKDSVQKMFHFLKNYKVCASNGKIGPKRKEGDKQVPEGFYNIDKFKPNSNYHLALGISYPNISDKIMSDAIRPGGEIYIHGDCVSVGCLAIENNQIEELYLLCSMAKNAGQEYIPVHIFPCKFNLKASKHITEKLINENPSYNSLLHAMKMVFYYFEKNKNLPPILITNKGDYVVEEIEIPNIPIDSVIVVPKVAKKYNVRTYKPNTLFNQCNVQPVFEGGNENYYKFVQNISTQMAAYLHAKQPKTYIYTEFIVNIDGTVTNVQIKKGGNDELNDALITALENTKNWTPALKDGEVINYKMVQSFFVELKSQH